MKTYDLIIVGGGILGTFHAWHALKAGKKVLLLEKDNYPVGATVRNFGQVVPSGMTGKWFEYGVRGLEIYGSIQQEFDISVRKNGTVYIASDEDEQLLIHELYDHYHTKGYECTLLTRKATLEKYPALKASYTKEAIFFPREISVEPPLMIYRLQEYMRDKFTNFNLLYNKVAVACESANGGAAVLLAGGERQEAGKIIICSGYEFKLLYPRIFEQSGLIVSKLQMMRTLPMPEVQLEGNILTGLSIRRYECFEECCPSFGRIKTPDHYAELKKWGIHILFKKASDGSIIIGDSHEYADVEHFDDLGFKLNQQVNELMLKEAERIVDFNVYNIDNCWAGFYPQHDAKHIFELDVDENIHIRTGIGGKGMTAGAGYAEASFRKIFGA